MRHHQQCIYKYFYLHDYPLSFNRFPLLYIEIIYFEEFSWQETHSDQNLQ